MVNATQITLDCPSDLANTFSLIFYPFPHEFQVCSGPISQELEGDCVTDQNGVYRGLRYSTKFQVCKWHILEDLGGDIRTDTLECTEGLSNISSAWFADCMEWMFRCPVVIWMFRCPVIIWMFRCPVVLMDGCSGVPWQGHLNISLYSTGTRSYEHLIVANGFHPYRSLDMSLPEEIYFICGFS